MQSDVNTVCFADESGHLIYSGSDDTSCKVHTYSHIEGVFHMKYSYLKTLFLI